VKLDCPWLLLANQLLFYNQIAVSNAIFSVWRPLEQPVTDWPIAVCDARTVSPSDLVECDHVRRQYTGSTMYLQHNLAQRFYYLDRQSKDEVLIFKNFDSARAVAKCKPSSGSSCHVLRRANLLRMHCCRCSTCFLSASESANQGTSTGEH
jgi:hypothetical protein